MESGEGGKKTPQSLDSLTKDELVRRCKNLLQLAQKAKQAKDDAWKQCNSLKETAKKNREDLISNTYVLEYKNKNHENLISVKERQIIKMSEENESLLKKVEIYYNELKLCVKEKTGVQSEFEALKDLKETLDLKVNSLHVTVDEERKERKLLTENSCTLSILLKEKTDENIRIEETAKCLQLQVRKLKEGVVSEQERADQANEMLVSTRGHLNNVQIKINLMSIENKELVKKHEDSVRLAKDIQSQNQEVIRAKEKEAECENSKILKLEKQVEEVRSSREKLELEVEESKSNVIKDFERYKLRAQSVLKKSNDTVVRMELQKKDEELSALERTNNELNDKLISVNQELSTIGLKNKTIDDKHEVLKGNHSLLLIEITGKEQHWEKRSEEQQYKIVQIVEDKIANEERLQKTIESIKKDTDNIKLEQQSELKKLQITKQQLDASESKVIRLELVLQQKSEESRCLKNEELKSLPRSQGDIRKIKRGKAEGQEVKRSSINSPGQITYSPVPLDKLLNDSTDEDSFHDMRSEKRSGETDKHLSNLVTLLSESEAHNARLDKLTEVLKEEIRMYQRSEERHKHIENLEYTKNVILKFLTLSGREERTRLIPVLRTILQLKQEEVSMIEEFVKVDNVIDNSREGWSSYLQLWSSAP